MSRCGQSTLSAQNLGRLGTGPCWTHCSHRIKSKLKIDTTATLPRSVKFEKESPKCLVDRTRINAGLALEVQSGDEVHNRNLHKQTISYDPGQLHAVESLHKQRNPAGSKQSHLQPKEPAWRAPSAVRLPGHGSCYPSGNPPRRVRTWNHSWLRAQGFPHVALLNSRWWAHM